MTSRRAYCPYCDDEREIADGRCFDCCNEVGIPVETGPALSRLAPASRGANPAGEPQADEGDLAASPVSTPAWGEASSPAVPHYTRESDVTSWRDRMNAEAAQAWEECKS